MPWSAEEFRSRHAKHLTGAAAKKAAAIASAMVEKGKSEGIAIATGIKHGNAMMGEEKAKRRYGKK